METYVVCPYCRKVRDALSVLRIELGHWSNFVELRDGESPFDLDDTRVSCAQCHDTGHMLTIYGEQLLGVLVARLKAVASGQAQPEEVNHD